MKIDNSPIRSFGVSSLTAESDLEKLRFIDGCSVSLGVELGVVLCCSGSLRLSEFHLRCLFEGSLFPTAS